VVSSPPQVKELDNWAGGLFFPSVARRNEACNLGYASVQGKNEDAGYTVISTLIGPIAVQSVYGSTYTVCQNAAENLKTQPTGLPLLRAIVYVYNSNATFEDTFVSGKPYQVAFVALDKDGKEVARLTPTSQEMKGSRSDPNDPFRWLVYFDPNTYTSATVQALSQADQFQLLVNRNNGVEVYELSQTALANFE
jgi:hypothetical protein